MKDDMPKLSDQMPPRIMAQIPDDGKTTGVWHETAKGWAVEYIRADLVPAQEQPAPAPAESRGMLPSGDVKLYSEIEKALKEVFDWNKIHDERGNSWYSEYHPDDDELGPIGHLKNAIVDLEKLSPSILSALIHHAERNAVEVVTVEDLASAYEHLNTSTIWSLIDDKDIETIKKIFRNCGLEYV
jgi:hypothetical protein